MYICHFCERIFREPAYREVRLRPPEDLLGSSSSDAQRCNLCQLFRADLLAAKIFRVNAYEEYEIVFEHTSVEHEYAHVPILKVRAIPYGQIGSSTMLGEVMYRSYTDENGPLSKIVEGRIVARNPRSDIARARVSNLAGRHNTTCECSTTRSENKVYPALPKRVLDLGLELATSESQLRVFESEGQRAHYAALSHCWGSARFTMTAANFSDRLVGIVEGDMPKTFQNAVTVTRDLGLRYLWIDSLCIIQDDVTKSNAENEVAWKDFREEAAKMGDYYGESLITIAADCSADDAHGFLRQRTTDQRSDDSPGGLFYEDQLMAFYCVIAGEPRQIWLHKIKDSGYHMPQREENDPVKTEILQTRAWTLQERLLPRRVVHFGKQQNYLEDHENGYITFEDGMSHPFTRFWRKLYTKNTPLCYQQWYSMIEDFKLRGITNPSHTLPALSGLAQRVCGISNDQYLAGLWESDLTRGLLWVAWAGRGPSQRGKSAPSCTAPSWSWASTRGSVTFMLNDLSNEVDWDSWHSGHDHDPDSQDFPLCSILEARTVAVGTDLFGEIKGGYIDMSAQTFQIDRFEQHTNSSSKGTELHLVFNINASNYRAKSFLDDRKRYGDGHIPDAGSLFAIFVTEVKGTAKDSRFKQKSCIYGLILELIRQHPEKNVFRRAGLFTSRPNLEWNTNISEMLRRDPERQVIRIE